MESAVLIAYGAQEAGGIHGTGWANRLKEASRLPPGPMGRRLLEPKRLIAPDEHHKAAANA